MSEAINAPMVFSFGDPEPVLDSHLGGYLGVFADISGDYYRPPVDYDGLARLMQANAYHGPILHFKKDRIAAQFRDSPYLNRAHLRAAALDYAVYETAYFRVYRNGFGRVTRLEHLPAYLMRPSAKNPGQFVRLRDTLHAVYERNYIEFALGEVVQIKGNDVRQNLFGLPGYLGGIQSVLLSEAATLFRRKFFANGAHLGYILTTVDANLDTETAKALEQQILNAKGPGNFRSIYINIPRTQNGQREPVKVIPVGNLGSKDDHQAIKEITQEEMLIMHRVPPGLVPVLPANVGGFGDLEKTERVYYRQEVMPLQQVFEEINEQLGITAVQFEQPAWVA